MFANFSRKELGLPPIKKKKTIFSIFKVVIIVTIIFVVISLFVSKLTNRLITLSLWAGVEKLKIEEGQSSKETLEILAKLTELNEYDPECRYLLAKACVLVAENSRYQLGYYANAKILLENVSEKVVDDSLAYDVLDLKSWLAMKFNQDKEALDLLVNIKKRLEKLNFSEEIKKSIELFLINQQSYLLATTDNPLIKDPEKSLFLAKLIISSKQKLFNNIYPSQIPEFVDTLAASYYATGRINEALFTQTIALGLVDNQNLDKYIIAYDKYLSFMVENNNF